jgi:hypothetical protein
MEPSDLETAFFEHVPDQFCQRAVRMIFGAHRQSWDHCASEFPATEADNARPTYTRAKVEHQLRDVADLHAADGVTHAVFKAPGSGWNHTEVYGGPMLLTAKSVQTPCGLVDPADFRLELAASNQGLLFDSGPLGPHIYVMLLHSRYQSADRDKQRKYAHLPGSCYLAFPTSDLASYLHEINLFDRYPDIVYSHLPQEWDQAAVVTYMRNARKSTWSRIA